MQFSKESREATGALGGAILGARLAGPLGFVLGGVIGCLLVIIKEEYMGKKRAFISFDYDHDEDVRTLLAGQSKHPESPFDFVDASVKDHLTGDWKEKVRRRISNADMVIVICGQWTHTATGVAIELSIARELGKPYFLLKGRADANCTKPTTASATDKIYRWTWDNLKALTEGAR